jgi:predicted AAA+ superfamily ATPase
LQTEVADPPGLWRSFREALREDFLRSVGTLEAAEDAGLAELQDLLPAAAPRFATARSGCSRGRSASTRGSTPPVPTARVQR